MRRPRILPAFLCGCGQFGCSDAICPSRDTGKLHLALSGCEATAEEIINGWQKGEGDSFQSIANWRELMSGPLTMMQNALGAGVIAVGGGIANACPLVAAHGQAVCARILQRQIRRLVTLCPESPLQKSALQLPAM